MAEKETKEWVVDNGSGTVGMVQKDAYVCDSGDGVTHTVPIYVAIDFDGDCTRSGLDDQSCPRYPRSRRCGSLKAKLKKTH